MAVCLCFGIVCLAPLQTSVRTNRAAMVLPISWAAGTLIWANVHVWWDTLILSIRARRWRDKWLVWFKGPAWRPVDLALSSDASWQQEKFDPSASIFAKAYTFGQFWVVTYAALMLQAEQANLPRSFVLSAFVFLVAAVCIQGYWL